MKSARWEDFEQGNQLLHLMDHAIAAGGHRSRIENDVAFFIAGELVFVEQPIIGAQRRLAPAGYDEPMAETRAHVAQHRLDCRKWRNGPVERYAIRLR